MKIIEEDKEESRGWIYKQLKIDTKERYEQIKIDDFISEVKEEFYVNRCMRSVRDCRT